MVETADRATEAFRRLLAEGSQGGQATVDALIALSQRTVFVPVWDGTEELRTLVNATGAAALPVFTDVKQLQAAALRFGWARPDGTVPHLEIGSRRALRHVATENVAYLVVDIGAAHALEVERQMVEPLVNVGSRSDSSGPYAAVGRITSTMLERVSAPPMTPQEQRAPTMPFSKHGAKTPPPRMLNTVGGPPTPSVPAPSTSPTPLDAAPLAPTPELQILAPAQEPKDEQLDPLADVLRGYPEVEWAAICATSQGTGRSRPTIALRIDPSYRSRVQEVVTSVRRASAATGAQLEVLLLDDPELMRMARGEGIVFYPWRSS